MFELHDLIEDALARPPALIVVLDGIEDPHNFGAILRTCDAVGAHGVVRQTRHSAPLGGATSKASAGAVAHVRIADVVNVARALEELTEAGIWTVGLAGDSRSTYDKMDFSLPTAIVLGAEGTGLRRLVRERCEMLASIPMKGKVDSLNVSVAAGRGALRGASPTAELSPTLAFIRGTRCAKLSFLSGWRSSAR